MAKRRTLRVGCPMWAHRPWVGRFYPEGTKPGEELAHYASWCNAVEGNTTFYAEPSERTVASWADQVDTDFRFAFKLPRTVTHDKRLRDVAGEVRSFLDRIGPLGARLGPVQVQMPPSFGADDLGVLLSFLRRLPSEHRWSLEMRHRAYFDGGAAQRRLDDVCAGRGIGRVVLDARPVHAVVARSGAAIDEQRKKPNLPIVLDAVGDHPIVRLIGEDRSSGTLDGLLAWVDQVVAWLGEGRSPYVFVHQPDNLDSPGLARAFHAAVAERLPGVDALSEPIGQASLF